MNKSAMETNHCKKTGENMRKPDIFRGLFPLAAHCEGFYKFQSAHLGICSKTDTGSNNTGLKRGNLDMGLGPQSTSQNIKLLVELPKLSTIRHYPYIQYTAPESHSSGVKCSSPAFGRPLNLPAIYRRLRKLRKLLKHLGQMWRVSKSPQVAG
jgi:hypothetical protein